MVAAGIEIPRDVGERVDAGEERQIVRCQSPQHEASRLQPVRAVRQGHGDLTCAEAGRGTGGARRSNLRPG